MEHQELSAQFEELHIDEYNTIVLKGCNLDQTLTLTCLTIFLLALPLPSYYFTHIHLGVLDLVFHKRKETLVE